MQSDRTADLLLHRQPDRWSRYQAIDSVDWSRELDCWLVFDAELINSVLRSDDFRVSVSKDDITALEARLKVELRGMSQVVDFLPAATEAPVHAPLRKAMAIALTERADAALAAFGQQFHQGLAGVFDRNVPFDIFAEVFAPASAALVSHLSGLQVAAANDGLAPAQMLDRHLGLTRRKVIDGQIRDLLAAAERSFPPGAAEIQVAMAILGSDSLLGSIAETFLDAISGNPDCRLCDIAWSAKLTATAVPFIERKAIRQTAVGGSVVAPGQRVRLYLDVHRLGGEAQQDAYFGAGKHACLGRQISQRAWGIAAAGLGRIEKRLEVLEVAYRPSDFMFNFPSSIRVAIHDR